MHGLVVEVAGRGAWKLVSGDDGEYHEARQLGTRSNWDNRLIPEGGSTAREWVLVRVHGLGKEAGRGA